VTGRSTPGDNMYDLLMVALGAAGFAVLALYLVACERA
jgi:hypothetical protein